MSDLKFDNFQFKSFFGDSFKEEDLQEVLTKHAICDSTGRKISVYSADESPENLPPNIKSFISVEIGKTTLLFDAASFKQNIGSPHTKKAKEAFATFLLGDVEIKHKIDARHGIQIGKVISGTPSQFLHLFDVLKEKVITATDQEIAAFLKENPKTCRKEILYHFTLQHVDESKLADMQFDDIEEVAVIEYLAELKKNIPVDLETAKEKESTLYPIGVALAALKNVWVEGREAQSVKVSRTTSQLPYSIYLEYNPITGSHDAYIQIEGKPGKGSLKKVKFPIEWTTGEKGAFAKLLRSGQEEDLQKEAAWHDKTKECENIVRARLVQFTSTKTHEPSDVLHSEFMNMGSLDDRIKSLTPNEKKEVILGILKGLVELEKLGIGHNDLKPANVMLRRNSDGTITAKLGDLGAASDKAGHSKLGTHMYYSPEKFNPREEGDCCSDDAWAAGLVFHELIHDSLPPTLEQVRKKHAFAAFGVLRKPEQIRGKEPEKETVSHIIWELLDPISSSRLTAKEAISRVEKFDAAAFGPPFLPTGA